MSNSDYPAKRKDYYSMLKQSYWWPISGHQLLDLAIVSSFAKRRDVRRSFVLLRQRPHCAGWNAELYSHKRVNSCNIANTHIYHDYICIIYLVIFIFIYMYICIQYTLLSLSSLSLLSLLLFIIYSIILNNIIEYKYTHCIAYVARIPWLLFVRIDGLWWWRVLELEKTGPKGRMHTASASNHESHFNSFLLQNSTGWAQVRDFIRLLYILYIYMCAVYIKYTVLYIHILHTQKIQQ